MSSVHFQRIYVYLYCTYIVLNCSLHTLPAYEGESEHTTTNVDSTQRDLAAHGQRPFGWPGNRERSLVTGSLSSSALSSLSSITPTPPPQGVPWAFMQASSAPIFVIGHSDKGIVIKLCSAGMSKTVPMHVDPTR